jgi:hypothetical protein
LEVENVIYYPLLPNRLFAILQRISPHDATGPAI